uniref:Uncharacterized protein n=1 Tax=Amphimedon queenslandica TaxID=400682 RepID=A0A1X7U4N6_AMPQE
MKLPLIALCLLSFILINAVEANFKKDYCGNREFVPGISYPHLHCGKDFFTLSYSGGSKHVNFIGSKGVQCSNVKKVLDFPSEYGDINKHEEIQNPIRKFYMDYCESITVPCDTSSQLLAKETPVLKNNSNHKDYYQNNEKGEYSKPYNNRKEYVYDQEYNEEQGYEAKRKPYWRMRREYHKKRF